VVASNTRYHLLKKEELAQAVAGTDLDPIIIRSGREKLFAEDRYKSVFQRAILTSTSPDIGFCVK
jgi:hypothetical protein